MPFFQVISVLNGLIMSIKKCYKFLWATCQNIRKRQSSYIPRQKICTFQWPARLDQKRKEGLFDVTMGAFDRAEVCEAVGYFLLYQLSKNYNKKDIALYREHRLAILKASFFFFHEMITLQKQWKMLFISCNKLFSISRYSNFCIAILLSFLSLSAMAFEDDRRWILKFMAS